TQEAKGHAVYFDPYKKGEGSTRVYKVMRTQKEVETTCKTRFMDRTVRDNYDRVYPLPYKIFNYIRSYNGKHYADQILIIHKTRVDDDFIERYLASFRGKYPQEVVFRFCKLDAANYKMRNLIVRTKVARISVEFRKQESMFGFGYNPSQFITQECIEQISRFSDKCILNVTQNGAIIVPDFAQQCVTLTADFFPIICRFKELSYGLLILPAYDLIDLLMVAFVNTI
ncbi:hypothetical protein PMAYCL1PPCAC_14189, partial [Pristionchus mayeri]